MAAKSNAQMAFKDDEYQAITNQFQQIQECIGMYISAKGTEGAFHLYKEIFNNALDECVNENSPANTITTEYFAGIEEFVVSDNGRGIPFEEMVKSCSEKHTSTKFNSNRKYNKYSAGCNGVGLVVTTALSDLMEIKSVREYADGESKEKTIHFTNCILDEGKVKPAKKGSHGTTVTFKPSRKYLGDIDIKCDDIITWLRHMSYIMPPNVTTKFNYYPADEKEAPHKRTFEAVGLGENVKFLGTDLEFDPITVTYTEDEMELVFSFSYDKNVENEIIDSYCNYVITKDGGYHEDACISALCDYMVKAARKADPSAKYEVIRTDVRKGLIAAVNCRAMHVVLEGQHKSKVGSKEISEAGKPGITAELSKFFENNNTLLNKIIVYLRQMAKIRIESFKVKGIKPPKQMSIYDEADIDKYTPISERNKKDYCELIITEGDSALGAIIQTRHPYYQAIYTTGGVLKNAAELDFHKIVKGKGIQDLIKIIGCGIGAQFNINNLRWNKIILGMDADPDGNFIKSLTSSFLIVCMPELIEDGRLYSACPPLYTLSEKSYKKYKPDKTYLYDKREYSKLEDEIIASNTLIITDPFNDTKFECPLSKAKAIEWLNNNKLYLEALDNLSKKTACHPDILEHVCWEMILTSIMSDEDYEKHAKKYFKKYFPEMVFDPETKSIHGAYQFKIYSLIIDGVFFKAAHAFIKILAQNESVMVAYRNKHEADMPFETCTIGDFLRDAFATYNVEIEQRFKGLGEVDPKLLFTATINPKSRKLIRLTMEDREKAINDMLLLHGSKNVDARRQLLLSASIDKDDIDT